jgi:hypothetical protein
MLTFEVAFKLFMFKQGYTLTVPRQVYVIESPSSLLSWSINHPFSDMESYFRQEVF